jgi:hypothetical protein
MAWFRLVDNTVEAVFQGDYELAWGDSHYKEVGLLAQSREETLDSLEAKVDASIVHIHMKEVKAKAKTM